ncbi:general secretion pathway protein K [Variovorax sp. HW608]|uniref:type II secretion system minor pseudopilin GspK n=1 Tax=Variovorax sp. HW608 TaxID=1034889 RepID=UPI00081F77B9|nr:type II secretion system minor pseudopilin GspK [Variovorax sp. HW608]SCK44124.1 general secretion pathway protein K [Variovorax sp. HW608]
MKRTQRGAALLTAMLTVTLVATFAAAALWQQWRATEVEGAERARVQSGWVLVGALDWSRLILREDARASASSHGADHLGEPWAIPLAEAKLSSFLAADKNISSDALEGLPDAFLSGRIIDAQSKLNVMNLVQGGKPVESAVAAFTKLFQLLNLPAGEVSALVSNLQRALPPAAAASTSSTATGSTAATTTGTTSTTSTGSTSTSSTSSTTSTSAAADTTAASNSPGTGPLIPQHTYQLVWLGLSSSTAAALEPYVTVLPATTTPLNLNTASAEAIYASVPKLDLAGAKRLVERRARSYFRSLADANALVQESSVQFIEGQHSIATSYFEVQARLRLDNAWVEERTLLQRNNLDVRIVWRERGAGATVLPPKS